MTNVYVTNDKFTEYHQSGSTWYANKNADREERQQNTLLLTIAYAAQLLIYYNLWTHAIDHRDTLIDDQKDVLDYLQDRDLNVDFPFMKFKQEALNIPEPILERCEDTTRYKVYIEQDGYAVDRRAQQFSNMLYKGIPVEWSMNEGDIMAGRVATYTGSILSASAKRREEEFIARKQKIVVRSQETSRMNIAPVLSNLGQAIAIQQEMANIFAHGFNSAGIGLGAAWGSFDARGGGTSSREAG